MRSATVFTWILAIAASMAARQSCQAAGFAWEEGDGETTLLYDGKPALRYMHAKYDDSTPEARDLSYKPFHHVFSPDGSTLLTKGPGGLYPHHRGLFFGFNKVTYGDGKHCDVWHCTDGAHQSHVMEMRHSADETSARYQSMLHWYGAESEPFATEIRELAMSRPEHNGVAGWQIDFSSHVTTTDGKLIHLDGDPQHAGFHFRAAQEDIANTREADQNREKQTYFVRTDGKGEIGEARNWDQNNPDSDQSKESINRPWNAMSYMLGGQRYTVLYLDHPSNPKPARYSERAYGRFGSYFVADVTADKPLNVKYRVWIQPGEMTVEQCQKMSGDFNTETSPDAISQAVEK